MEDIYGIGTTRCIDHPKSSGLVPDPNFLHTDTDQWHRLEIVGWLAALHALKLAADIVPCVARKLAQALQGVTEESNGFHGPTILVRIYTNKHERQSFDFLMPQVD